MDSLEIISGRLASRVVGVVEVISNICFFCVWIWVVVDGSKDILHKQLLFIIITLFGVYFMAGIVESFLLVYSTSSVSDLLN